MHSYLFELFSLLKDKILLLGIDAMNQLRREAKLLRMEIFALALAVLAGK